MSSCLLAQAACSWQSWFLCRVQRAGRVCWGSFPAVNLCSVAEVCVSDGTVLAATPCLRVPVSPLWGMRVPCVSTPPPQHDDS